MNIIKQYKNKKRKEKFKTFGKSLLSGAKKIKQDIENYQDRKYSYDQKQLNKKINLKKKQLKVKKLEKELEKLNKKL